MDQRLPTYLRELFQMLGHLFVRKYHTKFIEWVKEFIPEQLNISPHRNLSSSLEDLSSPRRGDFLAAFLAFRLLPTLPPRSDPRLLF